MTRLRVVKVLVQPVCVADDGEHIEELSVQPISVPWSQWQTFIDGGFDQALDKLRADVEAPAETTE